MRNGLFILISVIPQIMWAATPPAKIMSSYSDYDPVNSLRASPVSSSASPSVRACTYYQKRDQVIDVSRLELHSRSCESGQSIDSQLPDRPESDIYRVGEPFDVPKRN